MTADGTYVNEVNIIIVRNGKVSDGIDDDAYMYVHTHTRGVKSLIGLNSYFPNEQYDVWPPPVES